MGLQNAVKITVCGVRIVTEKRKNPEHELGGK
jgi:hypothetical protein